MTATLLLTLLLLPVHQEAGPARAALRRPIALDISGFAITGSVPGRPRRAAPQAPSIVRATSGTAIIGNAREPLGPYGIIAKCGTIGNLPGSVWSLLQYFS